MLCFDDTTRAAAICRYKSENDFALAIIPGYLQLPRGVGGGGVGAVDQGKNMIICHILHFSRFLIEAKLAFN